MDIDRSKLEERMRQYFDPMISHEGMAHLCPRAMESGARFDARRTRDYLVRRGFKQDYVVRYLYRPMDYRWLYWEPETKLLDEKREDYFGQVFDGNVWIGSAQRHRRAFDPPVSSSIPSSRHIVERGANLFPIMLNTTRAQPGLFDAAEAEGQIYAPNGCRYNLSDRAIAYLEHLGCASSVGAEGLFYHTLAILHAPEYAAENSGALQQDWPRVPLPASGDALLASAGLGRTIAGLLDVERPVDGVTSGAVQPALKAIAVVSRQGGGHLDPEVGELDVTAGWGYAGKGGVTMPAKGRVVERGYTLEELAALEECAASLNLTVDQMLYLLGGTTRDIFINDVAYWRNVPAMVWEYSMGGYQVIKKWLSYRERELLNRALAPAEVRQVTDMARRIASLLLLGPAFDANYRRVKETSYAWVNDHGLD